MPSFAVISASARLVSSACARLSSAHGPAMSASGRSLPMATLPTVTWRGATMALDEARAVERRFYERSEERVRVEGLRLELGVELHADEPRMLLELDDLG